MSLRREVEGLAKGSQGSGWDLSCDPALKGLGKLGAPCTLRRKPTVGLGCSMVLWDPAGAVGLCPLCRGHSNAVRYPRGVQLSGTDHLLRGSGQKRQEGLYGSYFLQDPVLISPQRSQPPELPLLAGSLGLGLGDRCHVAPAFLVPRPAPRVASWFGLSVKGKPLAC